MAHRTRLPASRHLQSVVEWRYPRAHRYWDDCGKLIAAIEAAFSGLVCQGIERDGFAFTGRSNGITAAKFYWDKSTVTQVGIGDDALSDAVARFWRVVQPGMDVADPSFVGHRTWLCYETASPKEALRWLDGLGLWTFAKAQDVLGSPLSNGTTLRTQLEPEGRRLRLNLGAGTMNINGKEHHGVIVDADFVVQSPSVLPADFREYVDWNLEFLRASVEPLFRSK